MPFAAPRSFTPRLATWPWRRVAVLAAVSLVLALGLVGYLFGVSDHFFGRLTSSFFIFFWLLAVTFLAVVPFVTWATAHWFGRGWAAVSPAPGPSRRPAKAPAAPGRGPARPSSSHAASPRPVNR